MIGEIPKHLARTVESISYDVSEGQVRVADLIMATPSGEERNMLTEANVHLLLALDALKKVTV